MYTVPSVTSFCFLVGGECPSLACSILGRSNTYASFCCSRFCYQTLAFERCVFEVANTHTLCPCGVELFLMYLVSSGFASDDTGKTRTDNLNVLPVGYGLSSVMKDLKLLLVDKVYVTNILGNHFSYSCVKSICVIV